MYSFRFFSLLFLFIPTILCGQIKKKYKISRKIEKQFLQIDAKAGEQFLFFNRNNNSSFETKIRFPKSFDPEDSTLYPLVIALHWAGNGNVYKEHSACLVEPAFESIQPIIIAPEGEGQVWSTPDNEKKILELTQLAIKHWPVDPKNIIVTGYSNGGNGSWYFAENYPNIFTLSIPLASAYLGKGNIEIPMFVIHGTNDELFPIARTKKWVDDAKLKGSDITWKPAVGKSHYMACGYVEELKEAVDWIRKND